MEKFIELLKDALDREGEVKMEDNFREYEEWSSLAYLSIIAFMDEEYDTQVEGKEFKNLKTVQELFDICTKK